MFDGEVANTVGVDYEPTSVSIHPSKSEFAVGGSMDQMLHVYSLAPNGTFEEKKVRNHRTHDYGYSLVFVHIVNTLNSSLKWTDWLVYIEPHTKVISQ